jgi:N-acetylmuramate 1-kinase
MQRQQAIESWLAAMWPGVTFELAPASADASFRRYFRVSRADGASLIVMDAPPPQEDVSPWLAIQQLMQGAGVHVPEVLAQDVERGFLLLSDLGNATYLSVLDEQTASLLYGDATDTLIDLQKTSRPGVLPEYDKALLQRELDLFPDWFLATHHALTLDEADKAKLRIVFERILAVNLAEPQVFVHRDYHARNLMVIADQHDAPRRNPGVIDFQDAVYGPITYDLVSLFKDAYIKWDEEVVLDWLIRYWEGARKAGLPVRADFSAFHRDYEWMGVQRHLKVLGIFARLAHRDGKEAYVKDMPLVAHYLRTTCARYDELSFIVRLLDRVENTQVQSGYTF